MPDLGCRQDADAHQMSKVQVQRFRTYQKCVGQDFRKDPRIAAVYSYRNGWRQKKAEKAGQVKSERVEATHQSINQSTI